MKQLLWGLTLSGLLVTGTVGCSSSPPARESTVTRQPQSEGIALALPQRFKMGGKSGQLVDISTQEIILSVEEGEESIPLEEKTELSSTGEVFFIGSGKRVIRGEDEAAASPEVWAGIPIANLQIQGDGQGAWVNLSQSQLEPSKVETLKAANHLLFTVQRITVDPDSSRLDLVIQKHDR
ncbi:hypothetical protein PN462_14770 [Spirulina sp. CS-785/01]|uniref:hypothetical protein n=1 Tax=Spirulina sp. CS-785/01 TaxID=3021716 RepID=UPI00232C601C|nr:hypothetical protein [Spirulina sp. CS-785/01]MDB9314372.1 hypothetical protein [Spirulina sp. CS-785/01]